LFIAKVNQSHTDFLHSTNIISTEKG